MLQEGRFIAQRLALLIAATVSVVPAVAAAQDGRISGVVTDSGRRPLENASVSVPGTRFGAFSDAQGRYGITLPAGTYTVRVQRIGMKAQVRSGVQVTGGSTTTLDIAMEATAVQLGGVVVSASRRVEKVTDAPATVTRLDDAQIAATVGNSFAPALKHVKGIDFIQVGVTATAINARGFNSSFNNRMLMMEDGRIAVLPENGLAAGTFTTLNKLDLAGVEVLVGPGAALYGPDASNGVLTLQSKDPKQYRGTSVEASAGMRAFRDIQFRQAGVTRDGRFGYKVSGEYQSANDFENSLTYALGTTRVRETGIGGKVDWGTNVARGNGALVYYQGDNRLEFSTGMSNSNGVGQTNVGRNQLVDWQYRHVQLKYTAPRWYANVYRTQSLSGDTYAINRYSTTRPVTAATISDDSVAKMSDFPADGRLYAAEVQNNFTIDALNGTRIVWGGQFRRDQVSSKREWLVDRVTGEDLSIQQTGVYGQTETPLGGAVRVILAARYDKHDDYDAQFSPKAGILWTPVNDQTFRVTFNQAFKSPTTLNNYFSIPDFVKLAAGFGGFGVYGNKEGFTVRNAAGATLATYVPLVPEKNTTWELGYKGIIKERFYFDAALYQADYENFISPLVTINSHLAATPTYAHDASGARIVSPNGTQSVLTYLNLGKAQLRGTDMGFRWIWTDRVAAVGTLSLTKLQRVDRKPTDPPAVVEATALNTTPTKWNAGLDFNSEDGKTYGGFTVRHVTGYNFRSGINLGVIPTFETLDLTFGRRVPSLGATVNVSLQNLWTCRNGFYEDRLGSVPPGTFVNKRNCNIGLKHMEMINMPQIGPMLFVGVRYDR